MASSSADRNLLLGVLALQMDFIDQGQLVAALHAWVLRKQEPLSQLLEEQGALTAARRELLEALVAEHLKQHQDDPQQSLASISSLGPAAVNLADIADPDLQASLQHVAEAAGTAEALQWGPTLSVGSQSGRRFRILRPLASGGLGRVSVALDDELHRQVALKELHHEHAEDEQYRSRFLVEAEITGRLEHPGIVPVYGLGANEAGQPFYAMRFIEGDSLREAIERHHAASDGNPDRDLALRRLLGRFLDVCNAVHYAHSRGVLHRDLKPGNIMLGAHGETLVVDWGLAKTLDETDDSTTVKAIKPLSGSRPAETAYGTAVGTPAFMSPEQASGRLDELGPRSDVYSLGATLYCLLTGQAPFSGDDAGAVLRQVIQGDFGSPRSLQPSLPRPLEAICRKAMAREPDARYETALELAEDIERWLGDRRVTAHQETLVERGGRFLRTHRTWVRAAAVVLLILSIGSLIAAVWIDQERRRANQNAVAFQKQSELATAARERERAERERANENARIASSQRDITVQTLETLVSEVQDKLGDRPGLEKLKQEILQIAIDGLKKVARQIDVTAHEAQLAQDQRQMTAAERREFAEGFESGRLAALDFRLAVALRRMGDIFTATGQLRDALEQFEGSGSILQRLADVSPRQPLIRRSLAIGWERLGSARRGLADPSRAEQYYQRALALRQALAAAGAKGFDPWWDLAVAYAKLGLIRLHVDDYPQAFDYYRRSLLLRQRVAAARKEDPEATLSLAYVFRSLGRVSARIGLWEQARDFYRESLRLRNETVRDAPETLAAERLRSAVYPGLGNAYRRLQKPAQALHYYRLELQYAERVRAAAPDSLRAKKALKNAHNRLGKFHRERNEIEDAIRHFREEIRWAEQISADAPHDMQWQTLLAAAYFNMALAEQRAGRFAASAVWSSRGALIETRVRAMGNRTEWLDVPVWAEKALQVANPRRGAVAVVRDEGFATGKPAELALDLLLLRASVLATRKQWGPARQAAERMRAAARDRPHDWLRVARGFAACCTAPHADGKPVQAPPELRAACRDRAVECLRKAIQLGANDWVALRTDPDLFWVVDHPEIRSRIPTTVAN